MAPAYLSFREPGSRCPEGSSAHLLKFMVSPTQCLASGV